MLQVYVPRTSTFNVKRNMNGGLEISQLPKIGFTTKNVKSGNCVFFIPACDRIFLCGCFF